MTVEVAHLIIHNARVPTLNDGQPNPTALAVSGGRFCAVGTDAFALRLRGPSTQVVDAGDRRTNPGLVDSHTHVIRGGLNYNLELRWDGVPSGKIVWASTAFRELAPPPLPVSPGWSPTGLSGSRNGGLSPAAAALMQSMCGCFF